MLPRFLAIARNTFLESIRQPIYFVLLMVGLFAQIFNLLLSAYSMGFTEDREVSGDDKLLLDMGLATVMVCATLLAAFIATNVLSREIENRTVLTVISKPVGRPLFILGKYAGVALAMTVAVVILLVFFLFGIKHKVMSTARDTVDLVVVLCLSLAVLGPIALGVWGNYFYGWVFSSTAALAMLPATVAAYTVALTISKEWKFQAITTDFKPQIMLASACVLMSMLVLSAIAIACSTRLGQVMTIVTCAGIFMLGLLSNHLLGRYAFSNAQIAMIKAVAWPGDEPSDLTRAGQSVRVTLDSAPRTNLKPGDSFYYGPDPSGITLEVPDHPRFEGDPANPADVRGDASSPFSAAPPALIVREIGENNELSIVNARGLAVRRPPREGDFAFAKPTRRNALARAAWSVVPNLQFFWLVDAISQGHKIPARYVALLGGYSACHILAALGVAVVLFQRRDVG